MSTQIVIPLYAFQTAVLESIPLPLTPQLFRLTVSGQTASLNPTITLVNTHEIQNGYLVVQVCGDDGPAIGSAPYERSIDIQEMPGTAGVVVQGADGHSLQLNWHTVAQISRNAATGLFYLQLQSDASALGAPVVNLRMTVDAVNNTVSGLAVVTQALAQPVVCKSHVTGNLIYETVMPPDGSKIRIDVSGYPIIHWPAKAGIGPEIPKNFSAIILLDADWSNGVIEYQYNTGTTWNKVSQKIAVQNPLRKAA